MSHRAFYETYSSRIFKFCCDFDEKQNEKVNTQSDLLRNSGENPVEFTQEIVEKVYEVIPNEQKYFIDEVGDVWKYDPVGVVRQSLERMQLQIDPAWYSWGTKISEKITKGGKAFNQLIDKITDFSHLTRTRLSKMLYGDNHFLDLVIKHKYFEFDSLPGIILELMYKVNKLDLKMSSVSEIFTTIEDLNNYKVQVYVICKNHLRNLGFNPEALGFSIKDILNKQLFNKLNSIVESLSSDIKPRSINPIESRLWYIDNKNHIISILESDSRFKSLSLEEKAKIAFHFRNLLKIKSRELFNKLDIHVNFMVTQPTRLWEDIVLKTRERGFEGIYLWGEVIRGAERGNPQFDSYVYKHMLSDDINLHYTAVWTPSGDDILRLYRENFGQPIIIIPGLDFIIDQVKYGTPANRNPSIWDRVTLLYQGFINGHFFMDANKRFGCLLAIEFLKLNGYDLSVSNEDFESYTLRVLNGVFDFDEIKDWFEQNSELIY